MYTQLLFVLIAVSMGWLPHHWRSWLLLPKFRLLPITVKPYNNAIVWIKRNICQGSKSKFATVILSTTVGSIIVGLYCHELSWLLVISRADCSCFEKSTADCHKVFSPQGIFTGPGWGLGDSISIYRTILDIVFKNYTADRIVEAQTRHFIIKWNIKGVNKLQYKAWHQWYLFGVQNWRVWLQSGQFGAKNGWTGVQNMGNYPANQSTSQPTD